VKIVDQILPPDYMRYEFFCNIKYAIKDHTIDKNTEQLIIPQYYIEKRAINDDTNQLNQIKQRLLSTELTNEQINLVEELNQLLHKYIE
jgi:ATP-dependent Zn protease